MISKYSKAQFLHLGWQSGFSVISQESVVDNNCFFSSMHRMSKTTVYHLQPKGGLELVSKEEKICHQLHRVSFENVGQFHQSLKAHVQLNCYTFLRARFSFYTTVCPRRRKWPAWYFLSNHLKTEFSEIVKLAFLPWLGAGGFLNVPEMGRTCS